MCVCECLAAEHIKVHAGAEAGQAAEGAGGRAILVVWLRTLAHGSLALMSKFDVG